MTCLEKAIAYQEKHGFSLGCVLWPICWTRWINLPES